MIELLLSGGSQAQTIFPNSGPGTKVLQKGNQTLGYFGEVSGAELFNGQDLIVKFQPPVGAPNIWTGSQWFKFFRNGKVIYIARQPIMSAIGWNDIYNLGLAYGVRGNGLYPVGAGVEQFNPMKKFDGTRNWYLVPRMMTGVGVDPASGAVSDGGEWNQLLGRIITGTNTGVAEKWFTLAVAYAAFAGGSQMSSLVLETNSANVAQCWNRGGANDLTTISAFNKNSAAFQWRPVLELIPDTTLLEQFDVVLTPINGPQAPSIVDARIAQQDSGSAGLLSPTNVIGSIWPTKQPVITGASFQGDALNPVNVKSTTADNLNPFTISAAGTQLASEPANVVYSIANLNPITISGAYAA
jgi:hypothetical protein